MTTTHMEFASEIDGTNCADCEQPTVREAVLVNPYGLVLARQSTCVHCGHLRHRAPRRSRTTRQVHSGLAAAVVADAVSDVTMPRVA